MSEETKVPYWNRVESWISADMKRDTSTQQAKSTLKHYVNFLDERNRTVTEVDELDVLAYTKKLRNTYTKVTTYNMWRHLIAYYNGLIGERIIEGVESSSGEMKSVVQLAADKYDDQIKPEEWSTANPRKVDEHGESVIELDSKKIDKMVRTADATRDKLIIRMLQDTGLRASELCNVTKKQIEDGRDDRKIEDIRIAKRDGAEKTVYYTNRTDVLLTEYLNVARNQYKPADNSPYLLVSLRSERINPNWLNRIVRDTADDAEVQETLFTDAKGHPRYRYVAQHFRSNFAIKYIKAGGNLEFLRRMLGHADLETTRDAYLGFQESTVRKSYRQYIG